jgi:Rap1a immunity proteins
MRRGVGLALGALLAATSRMRAVQALPVDGGELLERCRAVLAKDASPRGLRSAGYCEGFVDAAAAGIGVESHVFATTTRTGELVCIPGNAETDQLIRVLVAYLEGHPAQLQRGAYSLARDAFTAAFPCPARTR